MCGVVLETRASTGLAYAIGTLKNFCEGRGQGYRLNSYTFGGFDSAEAAARAV